MTAPIILIDTNHLYTDTDSSKDPKVYARRLKERSWDRLWS